jgi:hypothetical protein
MARRLLYSLAVLGAGGLACSSTPSVGVADAAGDAKGSPDARGAPHREGGILDATVWEANVPDSLLGVSDALPEATVVVDPMNCVPPGTPSNAAGVGGYCSPGGGQCNHDTPDAAPTICTADFGAAAHLWFCTVACTTTAACGPGSATCVAAANGNACVPSACSAFAADASADGGDAQATSTDGGADGSDGGRDAGTDAHAPTDAPSTG